MKFTNFNDQANEEGLTLEEIGGPISVKYAAALQSPFHCSHSKPSSYPNCTDSGDIPNRIEAFKTIWYGHRIIYTRVRIHGAICRRIIVGWIRAVSYVSTIS